MNTHYNSPQNSNNYFKRLLLGLALIVGCLPAMAADYVITYTTDGTTYYLARNGTSGVQRVTTFDPTTCIWSCSSNTAGTTASTLATNANRYLFQTVNDTRYFLNYSLGLGTTAGNNYRVRTDNNLLYFYNSYRYIILSGATPTYSTTTTTGRARADQITSSAVPSTSTNPTINGADVLTATGNSTYTATGAAYNAGGYTDYTFNSVHVYLDANSNTITPANATLTNAWSLTDNAYATVNSTSGVVTVSSLPEYDNITLTLTVTATATGGTPAAPANTTLTATKEITIQGTKPSAPTISVNGTSVTLSTTAIGSTTIRYTLDGTNPTASTGTVYNGAIDLSSSTNSPVTIKAITVRNGNASDVSTETVTLTLPEPTITVNATAGTATIACDITGTTIYYTINGSEPTTSSTQYTTGLSGLSPMTTIKAIAVKSGWNNSPVASATVTIPSGVSGGVVTLFDYEDHNWTYYSGVPSTVDGGNYNTNYNGTLYSPNPRNVKITYDGNDGAVSIDESETEFVYYKTLEQGTTTGQYPYTVISNPFSKRPNGKGFGGWKIISGGDYIQGHSNNDVLSLDEEITFVSLPYPSINCTSAEIEFQATWVNLNNITYANNNTITYSVSGGNYETNILVLNRNVTGTITTSSPVTIMMVEPDGSSDYRNSYSFTGNITPNNNGVTKIEFTKWNSTNTLNCNNHSVTVGRGMTTTSQCASYVTGVTGRTQNNGLTTYSSNLNYHLKLESGTFTDVSFIAGTAGTNGYVNCNGTSNQIKGTLGNDYDRAKGDNTKLDIVDEIYLGYRSTYANGNQNNALFTCWVKSGNLCSGTNVTNTTFNNSGAPTGGYYGEASQCFYVSSAGSQTNIGKRKLYVEGGILAGIAGGIDSNNPSDSESFFLRMTGGQVRGVVYGSGAFAASSGIRRFIITGGTINGWVAAGCNGTDPTQSGGTLPSNTFVYVGGDAHVGNTTDLTLNTSSDGNVFGAGSGNSAQATTGQVNNSNVVIADECYVKRNVYGGGNYGYSNATATVYVTGGEVAGSVFGGSNQKQGVTVNVNMTGGQVNQGVYGGSNVTGTISQSVTMNINGGQVGTPSASGNIHGGGYGSATRVTQNVEVTLGKSGQTVPGVTVYGDVYGGSALGYVNGTAATTTYHTYVTLNKGTINGSLYGGGLGDGSTAANVYGPVQVKVYGGSVNKTDANGANGSGGVYGANNVNGAPQRSVTVDIYGTDPAPSANEYALFAVYGGGNQADYTYGNGYPQVTVHNCDNSIEYVYGGGNAAAVAATDVKIYGGNTIGTVFGGGNGTVTAANVTGNASTNIYGGTIGRVFGGSNSKGSIGGTISVNVNKQADNDPNGSSTACAMKIGELYGGGNMAASNVGSITIGCTGSLTANHSTHPENIGTTLEGIGYVYGGANQANITGDITLTMNSGIVGNLFGGNNTSGTISGGIQVNVEKDNSATCASDWYVGKVFGGGNLAQYTIPSGKSLAVNVLNGAVSGNVYGGGKGDAGDHTKGQVTGNPTVTIGDNVNGHQVTIAGSVFGGGDAGNVSGTPVVNVVEKCNTQLTTGVYGGGNAADVTATNVTINGGTIGDVFGGGNGQVAAANVTNGTSVAIHGGTIGRVFAGSNTSGTIGGATSVTVDHTSSCAQAIDEIYGGGNLAAGKAGTITINCGAENIGDVYGGANQADIGTSGSPSNITLNITGGQINNVFGGNNTSGDIYGTITVNVNKATTCNTFSVGNVFGAGNQAQYTGNPAVNILNGTVSGNVYGGGKGDSSDHTKGQVTGNPTVTIGDNVNGHQVTIAGSVFGGGDAGNVSGTPVVNVVEKCNTEITTGVYGGGNAADVTSTDVRIYGGTIGDVFGGGNGQVAAANVTNGTSVAIHGGTIGRVFAGGNTSGTIGGATSVTVDHTSSCAQAIDEIYGGGNLAAGNAGTITINCGSENIGDVYGGANQADIGTSGSPSNITLNITGGQINNVFGGNNTSGDIYGTITVNVNKATTCNTFSVGNVFGAGNQAQYTGNPAVNILNGTVSGNVYGGGKGDASDHTKGRVTGNPVVTIGDATNLNNNNIVATVTGDVYGGGDAGNVVGTPVVNIINKCNTSIGNVYGGGNAADVSGTDVNIDGGTVTGMVFGGGHGDKNSNPQKQADVNGNVSVNVTGGTINKVFGGSNSKGDITGTVAVNINKGSSSCDMHITEVYGGGNEAEGNAGTITIGCTGSDTEGIDDVYGGAREANINSDITLNITGGKIANVFGGNNVSGSISGGIEVNVNWTTGTNACANNSLGNVYGGGNLAQYTVPNNKALAVNILNGTVSGNVYGGGKGDANDHTKGQVTGNPVVTIGDNTTGHESYVAAVTGDVYGGGDAGNVVGTPVVNVINKCNTTITGDVYGGGNAADVGDPNDANVGGTDVNIDGGTISGMVFGGGHGDKNSSPQKEANIYGDVSVDVTGGTINKVFGGSNSKGSITGSVAVNINKDANSCDMHITEVYGGGNEAAGNAGTITIGCTGTASEGVGDVYGGANAANINNGIILNITGGKINNVFGGNNTSGTISGGIEVNVEWTGSCNVNSLGNVYGGGNLAAYTGSPEVNIKNGTVSQNVYGGGKGATAVVTGNPVVTIGDAVAEHSAIVTGDVYGGGDAAAVTGNTSVTYDDSNASSSVGQLFGGGNAAGITGTATVAMVNGKVASGIYGGCNSTGDVGGKITVNVTGGTVGSSSNLASPNYVTADVFGGGYGESTTTSGDIEVNINGAGVNIYGDVYGGSALGDVNDEATDHTTVNILNGTLHSVEETITGGFKVYHGGNVYGGGLGRKDDSSTSGVNEAIEAKVYGVVTVNIGSGTIANTNPYTSEVTGITVRLSKMSP